MCPQVCSWEEGPWDPGGSAESRARGSFHPHCPPLHRSCLLFKKKLQGPERIKVGCLAWEMSGKTVSGAETGAQIGGGGGGGWDPLGML